jgi:hypothetical protein
LGEEVVGAIFDHAQGKAKWDEDTGEDTSNSSKKNKRSKQQSEDSLVAAAECKGKKVSTEGTSDHFEKMLEALCPNHAYPKHAYKDYGLMKKFLARGSKKGDRKKKPDPSEDDAEQKDNEGFPQMTGCLMIFGEIEAYASKR